MFIDQNGNLKIGRILGTVLPILFVIILLIGGIGTVKTGSIGIRTTGNAVSGTVQPGYFFKIPFIQHVVSMTTQTQKETVESVEAASHDLQTVHTNVAVNYHVGAKEAVQIFTDLGPDYVSKVMDPAIQETVKATTASSTAEQLITQRPIVSDAIIKVLTEKMAKYGITVETVNITNFDFSPEFNTAIEKKVTAEQNAITEKNNLLTEQYKADQRIAQARGEAEAIRIQSAAIESQGGKNYVALQWINAWKEGGAKVPTFISGGSQGSSFLMNIGGLNAN